MATHGNINARFPRLSSLVLSTVNIDGTARDGMLRIHEILNLNLSAELVVLSGCKTALGQLIRGEGFVGLTQAFMRAGARHVIASLWQVKDRATAYFMKIFYQYFLSVKLSAAAALRQTQLDIQKVPHDASPYYWAAFVLHGQ